MKKLFYAAMAIALPVLAVSCGDKGGVDSPKDLKTYDDSLAYYFGQMDGAGLRYQMDQVEQDSAAEKLDREAFLKGMALILNADTSVAFQMGMQQGVQTLGSIARLRDAGINVDPKTIYASFAKAFNGTAVDSTQLAEINKTLAPLMQRAQEKMMTKQYEDQVRFQAAAQQAYDKNATAGRQFMANILKEEGVKTTESGVAYKIEKQGAGKVAGENDVVRVAYTGALIDGTVFDSSKNQFVELEVANMMPGFKEMLKTLPAGTRATIFIPENLAYGQTGNGPIEPGSTLVFDIEIAE